MNANLRIMESKKKITKAKKYKFQLNINNTLHLFYSMLNFVFY